MKISQKQASELLKRLGVDAEVVADEKEADRSLHIEAIASEITHEIKEAIRPDIESETLKSRLPAETGKLLGTLRSAAARLFGGTNKEYEDLDIKGILELGKRKYEDRTGREKTAWEQEREQLIADHELALNNAVADKDKEITNWKTRYSDRDINENLVRITEKIPRIKGDVTAHADMLRYKLSQKYDLKYNEDTRALEFYTKDGKRARLNNKDLVAEDVAKEAFTSLGLLVTDMRGTKPADVKAGVETGVKAGIDSIKVNHLPANLQHLAEELRD